REAERRLQELRAANPADDRARRGLAELYAATGNLVLAQEMLEARIKQAPERMGHRLDLVRYVVRLGNVDRGVEELNKILDAQPDHKVAHTLLGEIMLDRGDNDTARRHFEAGIAGEHPNPQALVQIGTLAASARNYREARPYFERALELVPDHAVAHNNLAYALAEMDADLDIALTHAQKAKALVPDNPDFADTLGLVYVKRGLNDSAVRVFDEIVAKFPDRVAFRYHFAIALHRSGERAKAREQLERALSNQPSSEEEDQIRALLAQIGS
ncbi:MAG: tetratricopeptide repeat protein, partial [bacterium]|nr:tetratricopeptide repeat protein [bacterium]